MPKYGTKKGWTLISSLWLFDDVVCNTLNTTNTSGHALVVVHVIFIFTGRVAMIY